MTRERVLLVDDDSNVLAGYQRQLRGRCHLDCALGPFEGLRLIEEAPPYAVVVSDMRMPKMNGVEFLKAVQAKAPESVRMMLTGDSDQQTAIQAINEGSIFRFLHKPCSPDTLSSALQAGVKQYRLVTAERELLEKTLSGSVKMLTEILATVSPLAFGRASRVRATVLALCEELNIKAGWELDMAAMLSQLGCVVIPETVLSKAMEGCCLPEEDQQLLDDAPRLASQWLSGIPRLANVATMITDAVSQQVGSEQGIPPSELLRLASDLDTYVARGLRPLDALMRIKQRDSEYHDELVSALTRVILHTTDVQTKQVSVGALAVGMVLAEDVWSKAGYVLVTKGQEVTESLKLRLMVISGRNGVVEPIRVCTSTSSSLR